MSENQKYQGALYKEKSTKKSKQQPRNAFVEDAPDVDNYNAITIVDAPPAAPSPPSVRHVQPIPSSQPVNVFDFLVAGETSVPTPHDTPATSKPLLGETNKPAQRIEHAPKNSRGESPERLSEGKLLAHDLHELYRKQGYSYGEEPVPIIEERPIIEYITPAPKHRKHKEREISEDEDKSHKKSSDKKRKRIQIEEHDIATTQRPDQEPEIHMEDAPPAMLHSGLTGGLNRLLSKSKYPPSPDYSNPDPSPPSPVKRSKPSLKEKKNEGLARGRNGALVKVRKRRSSDESRPRKQQRSHHSPEDHHSHRERPRQKAIEDRPKRKAIEYTSQMEASEAQNQQQLVVSKSRAELFVSFVTKGPDSEQGYSLHKALKRYHREREDLGLGLGRSDDEKELFKNLRLKRNERGEVVVFF